MKEHVLIYSLFASSLIHILAVPTISRLMANTSLWSQQNLIPINLIDALQQEQKTERAVSPQPPTRTETRSLKPSPQQLPVQQELPKPQLAPQLAKAEELPPKKNEAERTASSVLSGGGSGEAEKVARGNGAGILFGGGDVAVRPAAGTIGTGRGEEPPGPGTGERGFRNAKPIQTAKASYPPMALRMGLEADVTLNIFVDTEGKVTRVEIVKSASMGFDEEALKAVRQFHYEPARKDGENVSSEFTYIYRFRLEK